MPERSPALQLLGADLVERGIRDLDGEVESIEALLVSIGAPRLRRAGLEIPSSFALPEHRLYLLLQERHRDAAHSRYNALIRRLVSFERAASALGSGRMHELADAERIQRFMWVFGAAAREEGMCYLSGGATAVLLGWRETTLAVDIDLDSEQDELLRALPRIKDELRINVELASPRQFIPLPRGWAERSLPAGREGRLSFRHFDPYSQALAKLERGHTQDLDDVPTMLERGLVEASRLRSCYEEIEPQLYRFPAVDPADFRRSLEGFA